MEICEHMLERKIQHWPTGEDQLSGRKLYNPGDVMVLTCPRGCAPIMINIVENKPEDFE